VGLLSKIQDVQGGDTTKVKKELPKLALKNIKQKIKNIHV